MSATNGKVAFMVDHIKRDAKRDKGLPDSKLGAPLELGSPQRERLVDQARKIYRARNDRHHYLPAILFGEPAWEILLVLYMEAGVRPMNATSAALITNAPETTALRWAEVLRAEGLVESYPHPSDKRLRLLQLSSPGRAILDQYLTEMLHRYAE